MKMRKKKWLSLLGFILLILAHQYVYAADTINDIQQINKSNTPSSDLLPPNNLQTNSVTSQTEIQQDNTPLPVIELKDSLPEETGFNSWWQGDYATGNWMGLRTKLEDHGITIGISYMSDSFQKLRGGSSSKDPFKTYGLVDTNITLDTEKMGLWKGGTAFVRFQNKHGIGLGRDFVGDIQFFDAYDVRRFAHVGEYWYEQSLFKDYLKVKLGKQDANTDFTALDSGFNFLSNSFSYMPTMPALPTIPETALGAVVKVSPFQWLSFKSGIYDGDAKGGTLGFSTAFSGEASAFLINEADITHNIKSHPGHYMIGYWLKTEHTDELTSAPVPRVFGQNSGWYMAGEQLVWKENQTEDDTQGLTLLGQFGWSPSDRSEVARYFGAGAQYQGVIPGRNEDIIGIGTEIAKLSERLQAIPGDGRDGRETILELFYKMQITPWFALQPDMQFIFHPNGQYPTAFVLGLRTYVTL